jgi:hypothetical protein
VAAALRPISPGMAGVVAVDRSDAEKSSEPPGTHRGPICSTFGTDAPREAPVWRWRIGVLTGLLLAIAAIVAGKGILLLIGLPALAATGTLSARGRHPP